MNNLSNYKKKIINLKEYAIPQTSIVWKNTFLKINNQSFK